MRARRFLAKHGVELAFQLVDHKDADYRGKPGEGALVPAEEIERLAQFKQMLARERKQPHRLRDLAVDGNDLIALGFAPGPELGRTLRDLLHDVVEDPSRNRRDVLLGLARAKLRA